MAEEAVSLRGSQLMNQPHENGARMPIIDLTYERQKCTYERDKRQPLDRVLMLHSLSGNDQCTFAVQIIEQMGNLHEKTMVAEFESHASLLQKPDDRYQMRLDLETEIYNLNTVRTLGTNFFTECVDASVSTEKVVAIYLARMQAIRDRLSRKMQAMSVGRY